MSLWSDRVESSQAHALIAEIADLVRQMPGAPSTAALEGRERLQRVADHLLRRVVTTDPELVPPKTLQTAVPHLTSIRDSMTAYLQTGDPAQLIATNDAIDALLASSYFWVVTPESETDQARRAAIAYRRSVGQLLRHVEDDAAVTTAELAAAKQDAEAAVAGVRANAEAAVAALQQANTESISQIDTRATEAAARVESLIAPLEARVVASEQVINDQKSRLDVAIAGFQEQFSKAEATRTETFTQAMARLSEMNAAFTRDQEARAATATEEFNGRAEALLATVSRHAEAARKVLAALGREGITGGHVKYANEQRRMAISWSLVVVAALGLIFVYGVWSVANRPSTPIDWQWAAERVLVAGSMLLLAIFAMVQAARYRDTEQEARQAELDLAALDPYMALLPEPDQQKLKIDLAQRAFFQQRQRVTSTSSVGVKDLLDLLKEVVKK